MYSAEKHLRLSRNDGNCRWTGATELLDSLLIPLQMAKTHTPPQPTPQGPPQPSSSSSKAPQRGRSANPLTEQSLSHCKSLQRWSIWWGVYKGPRLALWVLATLLQNQQHVLLLHLIRGCEDGKDGLPQCLLALVDSVTRGAAGKLPNPSNLCQFQPNLLCEASDPNWLFVQNWPS